MHVPAQAAHTVPLVAVAHDIRSLHNVGAIYRTADAAGFSTVVCSGFTGAPPDSRIAKVALGAEQTLATEHTVDMGSLLNRLSDAIVVVLEQDRRSCQPRDLATRLASITPNSGAGQREIALIACGELLGAPPELRERADILLELPMRGTKESLNVSVAFGIAAFALAEACTPSAETDLRSRLPQRPVRAGVLTRGVTRGEVPGRLQDVP
jgi:23S rRNA (guanosine2251-2'-O)-methyltransferase